MIKNIDILQGCTIWIMVFLKKIMKTNQFVAQIKRFWRFLSSIYLSSIWLALHCRIYEFYCRLDNQSDMDWDVSALWVLILSTHCLVSTQIIQSNWYKEFYDEKHLWFQRDPIFMLFTNFLKCCSVIIKSFGAVLHSLSLKNESATFMCPCQFYQNWGGKKIHQQFFFNSTEFQGYSLNSAWRRPLISLGEHREWIIGW